MDTLVCLCPVTETLNMTNGLSSYTIAPPDVDIDATTSNNECKHNEKSINQ